MAGVALAMLSGGPANAGVVDKPTFKVGGLVVVWGATDTNATTNTVSDFYLLGNGTAADLIKGDVDGDPAASTVITGDLASVTGAPAGTFAAAPGGEDGVLDANSSYNAFAIDADTDVDALGNSTHSGRFFVASNTGFKIQATAVEDSNTFSAAADVGLDDVKFTIAVNTDGGDVSGTINSLAYGAAAQDPTNGGGQVASVVDLGDLDTTAKDVFIANQRTAASVGNLAAQSVRFDTDYTFDNNSGDGFDLSIGTGELTATVTYTIFSL